MKGNFFVTFYSWAKYTGNVNGKEQSLPRKYFFYYYYYQHNASLSRGNHCCQVPHKHRLCVIHLDGLWG